MAKVGVWLIGAGRASCRNPWWRGSTATSRRSRRGCGPASPTGAAQRTARSFLPRSESLGVAVERLGDDLDGFRSEQKLDTS